MAYNIPTIFVALAIGYTFLAAVHRITQDTKEPPSIHDGVPFISPLLAMFSKGGKFYRRLRLVSGIVHVAHDLHESNTNPLFAGTNTIFRSIP
jgi:hypothetical protein